MTAFPIKWHEESLKNKKIHLEERRKDLLRLLHLIAEINRLEDGIFLTETQITEAKRTGKTSFDSDKYLLKREKKVSK